MAYSIVWNGEGSISTYVGAVSLLEIQESNQELYDDQRFNRIRYSLFDFTLADFSTIESEETKYPAAQDRAISMSVENMKVALIAVESHSKSLCEAYIERSQRFGSTWQFGIFPTVKEALAWVVE